MMKDLVLCDVLKTVYMKSDVQQLTRNSLLIIIVMKFINQSLNEDDV